MKRAIVLSLVGMSIAVLAMSEPTMASVDRLLDGKTFFVEIAKKVQKTGDRDQLIFKDGKFRSTACDPYGFGEGAYKVSHGAMIPVFKAEFDAQTTSPTDGKMTWNGKVEGDRIEGTSVWEKPGQAPVENWFKGTLKK